MILSHLCNKDILYSAERFLRNLAFKFQQCYDISNLGSIKTIAEFNSESKTIEKNAKKYGKVKIYPLLWLHGKSLIQITFT
jgi:hypothetical protein